jgi:hypothetical protein
MSIYGKKCNKKIFIVCIFCCMYIRIVIYFYKFPIIEALVAVGLRFAAGPAAADSCVMGVHVAHCDWLLKRLGFFSGRGIKKSRSAALLTRLFLFFLCLNKISVSENKKVGFFASGF